MNAKRIYRLYIEEGLIVRTQTRKQRAQRQRITLGQALAMNEKWSMVAQRLADVRWVRLLTVVDQYTRECYRTLASIPIVEYLDRDDIKLPLLQFQWIQGKL